MHASRQDGEPAVAGRVLRASLPRPRRSRAGRPAVRAGGIASAVLHLAIIAWLVLKVPQAAPTEQQEAPSFAVDFVDAGLPAPAPPAPTAQPRVNLGGSDVPDVPPPEERPAEAVPVPPPARHYGSARRSHADSNPFAHIVPFDLSPRSRPSLATASNGRSLDLSAGPVVRNGALHDAVAHVRGTHGMSDWGDALREFVEEHKYYPQQAADNGEQGSAVLRLTVGRDGTVRKLALVSSSGSHLLDAAWTAVFRDNKLPPFNDDMAEDQITFTYELDYHLIYSH